jgi:hypothetical protein
MDSDLKALFFAYCDSFRIVNSTPFMVKDINDN